MLNNKARQSVWNPWHELNSFGNTLNRMLGVFPEFTPKNDYPPVNVWRGENEIRLTVKLPGVKAGDIEVNINRDTLTIKGQRKSENIPEGCSMIRQERVEGSFARSFALPFAVESAEVEATHKDGILMIRLPKAKIEQPRKIAIKSITE